MHMPWILLKFHSGIFRLFRITKNRKFRENVVTARAESILLCVAKCFLRAFVIVPLTFYSSMRQSYDTGCASSSDAQLHRTLQYSCSWVPSVFSTSPGARRMACLVLQDSVAPATFLPIEVFNWDKKGV